MKQIVVFDVETPNGRNDRICSIAVCLLQDGQVSKRLDFLVNPETTFDPVNISIHGISPQDVLESPTFPQIWSQLQALFESSVVVAHGSALDLSALKKTLEHYGLSMPPLQCTDTMRIARALIPDVQGYSLACLCDYFGIELCQHHQAGCDALACANLLLIMLRECHFDIADFVRDYPPRAEEPKRASSPTHFCAETQSLQMLQGLLLGIISDGIVNEAEFFSLTNWLENNRHLAGNYPFDRVYSAISHVLEDGIVNRDELDELLLLFQSFIDPVESSAVTLCYSSALELSGKSFVLTGDFSAISRSQLADRLTELGAFCRAAVSRKTDYVIVGELGSTAWKFGSYGEKVQRAQELIDAGANILIIKEKDFLTKLEESGLCLMK